MKEKKECQNIQSYSTDIAGNRVTVKVSKKNEKGDELYLQLEEMVDVLVEELGH